MRKEASLIAASLALFAIWSCSGGIDNGTATPAPVETGIEEDTTAPTVSSCSPSDGDISVGVSAAISCTFSEALATASVSGTNITLAAGAEAVAGDVTLSDDGTIVTFTPSSSLAANTSHTLTIGTGVTDANSVALAEAYSLDFTTIWNAATGCSATDDFSDLGSLVCFSILEGLVDGGTLQALPLSSYDAFDSVTISGGALVLNHNTTSIVGGHGSVIGKVFAAGDFAVMVRVSGGLSSIEGDQINLIVSSIPFDDMTGIFRTYDGKFHVVSFINGVMVGEEQTNEIVAASSIEMTIVRSGNAYSFYYKADSGDSTYFTTVTRNGGDDALGSTTEPLFVGIGTESGVTSPDAYIPQVDAFNVLSGTVIGQE